MTSKEIRMNTNKMMLMMILTKEKVMMVMRRNKNLFLKVIAE